MRIQDFRNYLLGKRIIPESNVVYYQSWVAKFLQFMGIDEIENVTGNDIKRFQQHLGKTYQEWQVNQAREAVRLYLYFIRTIDRKKESHRPEKKAWKNVVDEMHNVLRLKQRAYSTEKAYVGWLREFYVHCGGKNPRRLVAQDVKDFLSHLAVERRVSKSTQNQAFNALLLFFRHVLEKAINDSAGTVRAEAR